MITAKYTKNMLYAQFTADVLQQGLEDMITVMSRQVKTYYNGNKIAQQVNHSMLHVRKTPSSANATIDFPIQQRFLDIKKLKSGKKKRLYAPVYNKYLYGYVYRYIYPTLKYGLTLAVKTEITEKLKKTYSNGTK